MILLAIDDITAQEQALALLEAEKEYIEKIVDSSRDALLILDLELRVKSANETFYNMFGVDPETTVGRPVYELGNGQWDIPQLRHLLEHVLPDNDAFDNFEIEHNFSGIGDRIMVLERAASRSHATHPARHRRPDIGTPGRSGASRNCVVAPGA